ncbi:hypothetical protein RJ639_016133 [Escallonia herrerae]|uniref:TF-B3 domain-containing protein n=1 Tax=Escallonia herrerae TaxID=1293975 RepID=A0AA88VAE9_9ASTE|nr:hypothetical protein RJ639_016133 [Escallonia herrerae]
MSSPGATRYFRPIALKAPPKKAHFFKFIQPCFKSRVRVESFFKSLREEKLEQATLRRGEQKWPVTINGSFFENGWTEFAEDNGVEEGYFLVFRHEGDMVFDVVVFDQSTCEKEYPTPVEPSNQSEAKEKSAARSVDEDESNRSNEFQEGNEISCLGKAKATCFRPGHRPYFQSIVTTCSFNRWNLYIPTGFGRSHGLSCRHCEMILMYEERSSWPATLRCKGRHLMIGRGCREFFLANGIAAGDAFKLELIENGKKPVMNFCLDKIQLDGSRSRAPFFDGSDLKKRERVTNCTATKATLEDQPYYKSTLKRSNIIRSTLFLPRTFARRNCLSDGEMVLIDEKERSWPVQIKDMGRYVYIGCGWRDFRITNDLKEGDAFKFQLIQKGKIPIAKFYSLSPDNLYELLREILRLSTDNSEDLEIMVNAATVVGFRC